MSSGGVADGTGVKCQVQPTDLLSLAHHIRYVLIEVRLLGLEQGMDSRERWGSDVFPRSETLNHHRYQQHCLDRNKVGGNDMVLNGQVKSSEKRSQSFGGNYFHASHHSRQVHCGSVNLRS